MNRHVIGVFVVAMTAGVGVAEAAGVPGQGTWETTLKARDLTGDGVTDAFYDTVLDVTWLRDTTASGAKDWNAASAWVAGLAVGGYSGWRLPTMIDTGSVGCNFTFTGGTDCGFNVQTISADGRTVYSEMAHLWYDTLGNKAFCAPGDGLCNPGNPQPGSGLTNTGDFINLQPNGYWYGLQGQPGTDGVWYFGTGSGIQDIIAGKALLYAMAVRPGDVVAVPELETYALLLAGLVALGAAVRRRRQL